jgi:hypothetical protein
LKLFTGPAHCYSANNSVHWVNPLQCTCPSGRRPDPCCCFSNPPAPRVTTAAMCRLCNRSLSPSSRAASWEATLSHLNHRSAPSRSCTPTAGCHRRVATPQAPRAAAPSPVLHPSTSSCGAPRSIEHHWVLPPPEHLPIISLGSLSGAAFSSTSSTTTPRCSLARPPAPPTAPMA